MKKTAWFCLWISFCVLFIFSITSSAKPVPATDFSIYVNGERLHAETSPIVRDGTTFVPIRAISDSLGAEIHWDEQTGQIKIINGATQLQLTIDSEQAIHNEQEVNLEKAPFLYGDHAMVPLRWIAEALHMEVGWYPATKTVWLHEEEQPSLPVVGDMDQLKKLLASHVEQYNEQRSKHHRETAEMSMTADEATSGSAPAGAPTGSSSANSSSAASESAVSAPMDQDFSDTNVQVEGVDEADIIKTDGTYIFQVNKQRILVIKANPVEQMDVISQLDFADESFVPQEMYVDDEHLVVIGQRHEPYFLDQPAMSTRSSEIIIPGPRPVLIRTQAITALVYDRSNPNELVQVRELALEGSYISSRKVGSSLYIVTNQYVAMNHLMEKDGWDNVLPHYHDSSVHDESEPIDLEKMVYHPNYVGTNMLLVAAVDLSEPDREMEVTSFLGAGQTVYASHTNLYVATTEYEWSQTPAVPAAIERTQMSDEAAIAMPAIMPIHSQTEKTNIFRFSLNKGSVSFSGEGTVPGRILNQFSMDEHAGHFRIATTTGDMWRSDEGTSKNHLYVLDEALEIVGEIEDLAPGERIYSVRFMGDRGYIVTFRTVDPLFVMDLSSPSDPQLLGELKIPGYSDYLHPYDENHLIGFGKDVIVVEHKDDKGRVQSETAYDQGMKIALFDITDVHNPIEKFSESIGGRGTHSDVLHNHKALLFSKDKQLLSFPVTVMEVQGSPVNEHGFPEYGTFTFQGAYVYNVNVDEGFQLREKITHLTQEQIAKSGQFGYDSDNYIMRMVTIGDILYTLSLNHIKAHDLTQLVERNHLELR